MKKILSLLLFSIAVFINSTSLAETKTITFATEATYPPYEYVDNSGKIQGFDIDIAKALCAEMKVQCTFINQPWDSLIPSLKLGKFDAIVSAMQITEARKKVVDFTDPYYTPTASFVAKNTSDISITPEGIKGKIIGVQGGTTMEQYLQGTYGNSITIKSYASIQDAFLDLTSGRVNAVFGDTPIILDWLKKHGENQFKTVGQSVSDTHYFGIGDGIAIRKDNSDLLNALNKALSEIKANGTYDKIIQRYFSNK
jgi:arginine transport system substrate-binding protein